MEYIKYEIVVEVQDTKPKPVELTFDEELELWGLQGISQSERECIETITSALNMVIVDVKKLV